MPETYAFQPTFSVISEAEAFAATKSMLALYNAVANDVVVRVYQVYAWQSQLGAVTAELTSLQVRRITDMSGGTSKTPQPYDTNNSLDAGVTATAGGTVTGTDLFRRLTYLVDNITTGAVVSDWYAILDTAVIMKILSYQSAVEPIVCRAGYGIDVYHPGTTAVGSMTPEIVFTQAAS